MTFFEFIKKDKSINNKPKSYWNDNFWDNRIYKIIQSVPGILQIAFNWIANDKLFNTNDAEAKKIEKYIFENQGEIFNCSSHGFPIYWIFSYFNIKSPNKLRKNRNEIINFMKDEYFYKNLCVLTNDVFYNHFNSLSNKEKLEIIKYKEKWDFFYKKINIDNKNIYDFNFEFKEGSIIYKHMKLYERNNDARLKAIEIHGISCSVCGFNFKDYYGEIGENYIEVHHIIPLSKIKKDYIVDPKNDLIPLCSNCHRMIHKYINSTKDFNWKNFKQHVCKK